MGPRNAALGVSNWGATAMRTAPLGPSVGLPMGPRNAALGVSKWVATAMRTAPLGPSVELPMGPRNAALGGGNACGGGRREEGEERREGGTRGSSLQNEHPTPQDGWEISFSKKNKISTTNWGRDGRRNEQQQQSVWEHMISQATLTFVRFSLSLVPAREVYEPTPFWGVSFHASSWEKHSALHAVCAPRRHGRQANEPAGNAPT